MQFNSITFLFYFLPVFLLAYYMLPAGWRNVILVIGSLVFYFFACGQSLWQIGIMVGLTLVSFGVGRILIKPRNRWLLALYLAISFGGLMFLKLYHGGAYLPAGMSFYLFQIAAYLVDVKREKLAPERNVLAYGAKTVMFPKLLSGPLIAPAVLNRQEAEWDHPSAQRTRGLQELILGLGLKVLLADRLGGLWSQAAVIGYESISVPFAWMSLCAYAMRLYFDFWGYSLMAIGLGRMLGFDFPKNFDDPYASRSVSEFYRRWHITLGRWFREYVYIPLGGNRKGSLRTIVNLGVVWLFTGIWHGVGSNYLLWAGFLFLLIINEKIWLGKLLKKLPVVSHLYTVAAILISWIPFAIGDFQQMIVFAGRLIGQCGHTLNGMDFVIWGKSYAVYLIAGLVLATPFPGNLWRKIRKKPVANVLLFCLFWVIVYCIATAEQSPFLYFSF